MFVCIIASSVVLGIELDQNKGSDLKDRMPYFYADMFFLLVFIFEMFARQHKLGRDWECPAGLIQRLFSRRPC